jgi:hypothetical protein
MKTIELEDLVTLVCTEFVKQNKNILIEQNNYSYDDNGYIPYLKMNWQKRRKISEKIIDSLLDKKL